MKYLSLAILIILSSFSAFAEEYSHLIIRPASGQSCSSNGTLLLYVNGQENEKKDSLDAKRTILEILAERNLDLKKKIDVKGDVSVKLIHNPTKGKAGGEQKIALADFIESAVLIIQSYGVPPKLSWVLGYGLFVLGLQKEKTIALYTEGNFESDERLIEAVREPIYNLYNADRDVSETLKEEVTQVINSEKKKLVIISHSQGNLFTNKVFGQIKNENPNQKSLRFVANSQVATPVAEISIPANNYITNHLDEIRKVPGSLRTNFPQESNTYVPPWEQEFPEYDWINHHGFLKAYLFAKGSDGDDGIALTENTIQNWVDVAAMLPSNCLEGDFQFSPSPLNPLQVSFSSWATSPYGDQLTFTWDFGDFSGTSSETFPTYTYKVPGFYNVTLTVSDGSQNILLTKTVEVKNIEDNRPPKCEGEAGSYLGKIGSPGEDVYVAAEAKVSPMAMLNGNIEICGKTEVKAMAMIQTLGTGSNLKFSGTSVVEASTISVRGKSIFTDSHIGSNTMIYVSEPDTESGPSLEITNGEIKGRVSINSGKIRISGKTTLGPTTNLSTIGRNSSITVIGGYIDGSVTATAQNSGTSHVLVNNAGDQTVLGGISSNAYSSGEAEVTVNNSGVEANGNLQASSESTGNAYAMLESDSLLRGSIAAISRGSGTSVIALIESESKEFSFGSMNATSASAGDARITLENILQFSRMMTTTSSGSADAEIEAKNSYLNGMATVAESVSTIASKISISDSDVSRGSINVKNSILTLASSTSAGMISAQNTSGTVKVDLGFVSIGLGGIVQANTTSGSSTITISGHRIDGAASAESAQGSANITLAASMLRSSSGLSAKSLGTLAAGIAGSVDNSGTVSARAETQNAFLSVSGVVCSGGTISNLNGKITNEPCKSSGGSTMLSLTETSKKTTRNPASSKE